MPPFVPPPRLARAGGRDDAVRCRRRLARLCLGWMALSLACVLTPLAHWLHAGLSPYSHVVIWLAPGVSHAGLAMLLAVLSSGLRRGHAVAFWLLASCLALGGPLGWLASSAATGRLGIGWLPAWFWGAAAVQLSVLGVLVSKWRAFPILRERARLAWLACLVPVGLPGAVLAVSVVAATDLNGAPGLQQVAYVFQRLMADSGLWPVISAVNVPGWVNLFIDLALGLPTVAMLCLLLVSPPFAAGMTVAVRARYDRWSGRDARA